MYTKSSEPGMVKWSVNLSYEKRGEGGGGGGGGREG